MSLLWFAIATAAAKNKREAEIRNRKRNSQKKEEHNTEYSYAGYYSTMNYYDCVMEEIKDETSDLSQFFEMLKTEYMELCKEKKEEYELKKEDLIQQIHEMTPHFDQIVEELAKDGIKVRHNLRDDSSYNYLILSFNDIKIIDGRNSSLFFEKLEQGLETVKAQEKKDMLKIRELTAEIYLLKKKLNKVRFNKKKFNHDLEVLEENLKKEKENYNVSRYKETIEVVNGILKLDDNKKQLLLTGIDELMESISVRKKVADIESDIYCVDKGIYSVTKYDSERMTEVMERLAKKGKITEETLHKIFLLLDEVEIKYQNEEYGEGPGYYQPLDYRIVKWFVNHVYEESKKASLNNRNEEDNTLVKKKIIK